MSGAFNEAAEAVIAVLGEVATVVIHAERYAGQDFARMRELVRSRGTCVFVRTIGASADGDDRSLNDCANLAVQLAVAAPAAAQDTALDNAWSALSECYEALRGTRGGIPWLLENLRFVSAAIEEQAADCAVVQLTMAAHVDLADLDDSVMVPDDDVPAAAKDVPVGADRLTLYDSAAGWARRYLSWDALLTGVRAALDTVYAAAVHTHDDAYDPAGAAAGVRTAALTPAEYTPGAMGSTYAVDYATDRQVQDLGTISAALELTKGTGWPAVGMYACVTIKLVISGIPVITWTVVDDWLTDSPAAPGTYYLRLELICGNIVASAGGVQA
jgi:hypothetical protein